jgi:molybdopterin synthase sulfur carrier subunit
MEIKILSFGICRDILGQTSLVIEVPKGILMKNLKMKLISMYPKLKELNHIHIAINEQYAEDNSIIKDKDEIALVPPVSGG